MADATYQPKVYKAQGGATLVITSSGTLTLEGTQSIASGGTLSVASGGTLSVASGGTLSVASGGAIALPVQTVSSSATTITAMGVSVITATSTGQSYLMSNPISGCMKYLCVSPSSTAATATATIVGGTTGITFGTSVSSGKLTIAGAGTMNVSLVGISTSSWRVLGTFSSTTGGIITAAS